MLKWLRRQARVTAQHSNETIWKKNTHKYFYSLAIRFSAALNSLSFLFFIFSYSFPYWTAVEIFSKIDRYYLLFIIFIYDNSLRVSIFFSFSSLSLSLPSYVYAASGSRSRACHMSTQECSGCEGNNNDSSSNSSRIKNQRSTSAPSRAKDHHKKIYACILHDNIDDDDCCYYCYYSRNKQHRYILVYAVSEENWHSTWLKKRS